MEKYPLISIIVTNFNGKKWLKQCFDSILKSDYPKNKLEIIFVDNGSIDDSVGFVKKEFGKNPRIKIVYIQNNIGWSPAINEGIKNSKGNLIVCLSNDMKVDSKWLKYIINVMEKDEKIGIVQCMSVSMFDRKRLDSGMNFFDRFGYPYGYIPKQKAREVFFAEGMAFAFKKEVVESIGMLDDYYFMEYDDMDFSWRARLLGYKVFFSPKSVVYHARGGTVGGTYYTRNLSNISLYIRNHFTTLIKNYELKNIISVLPGVIMIELLKLPFFIKGRNKDLVFATLRGLFWTIKDIKIILKKRRNIQKIRKVSDKEIMKRMVPFNPKFLYEFISLQNRGERLFIRTKPVFLK